MRLAFTAICICVYSATAQQVHRVPFESRDNVVELAVRHTSSISAQRVSVEVLQAPAWLTFSSSVFELDDLGPQEMQPVEFAFSVDNTAPVDQRQTVTFVVSSSSGEQWRKEISIAVDPPREYRLFDTYPNPFNPSTTVEFELPEHSYVTLRAYDLLGREVALIVEGELAPGHHRRTWNAAGLASGVYVIVLHAEIAGSRNRDRVVRLEQKVLLTK